MNKNNIIFSPDIMGINIYPGMELSCTIYFGTSKVIACSEYLSVMDKIDSSEKINIGKYKALIKKAKMTRLRGGFIEVRADIILGDDKNE